MSADKEIVSKITAIHSQNSIGYIRKIFSCFEQNKIAVPLRSIELISHIEGTTIEEFVSVDNEFGWYSGGFTQRLENQTAMISFTSGTQGVPKGILLSHANLADVVRRLTRFMEIDGSIREYIGVPVYHSFGFGRVRTCLSAGGSVYIPENGFNLIELSKLLKSGAINSISAVPTLLRLVFENSHLFKNITEDIKWIEIGSQYMSAAEKEQVRLLFPKARVVMHYGLTEASRSTFLDISNSKSTDLESVGRATDGVEIRTGRDGVIEIRGEHVAQYKLGKTELIALTDHEGWIKTSDMGVVENNYLYYQGRVDDQINIGGLKISPEFVEREILLRLQCEKGVAVTRVPDELRGNGIQVVCETELFSKKEEILTISKSILAEMNIHPGSSLHIVSVDSLPVTDTGKTKRNLLEQSFNENQKSDIATVDDFNVGDKDLAGILQRALSIVNIHPHDSMINLGIDSLQLITASVHVEKYLGFLPDNWGALQVKELESLRGKNQKLQQVDKSNNRSLIVVSLIVAILIAGEVFLQTRSHVKTGRSVLNIVTGDTTMVFNKELGQVTYRPLLQQNVEDATKVNLKINSQGLRNSEIGPIKENELRLVVVGASTVAGIYAQRNEETFSKILAKLLQVNSGKYVNVINAGIPGYTISNINTLIEKVIIPLQPSAIIVYTGFNDMTKICKGDVPNATSRAKLGAPVLPKWIMSKDMIRKNTDFLRQTSVNNPQYINPQSIDFAKQGSELEKLVLLIKSANITPILMTNARSYKNVPDELKRELATLALYYFPCLDLDGVIAAGDSYNSMIRRVAKTQNTKIVDLGAVMPGGKEYFVDGIHFSLKGEKFTAKTIHDSVSKDF